MRLLKAKESMIMQLFNKPDYLVYLESEKSKKSEVGDDAHETPRTDPTYS
jgi:hypothetical protein